MAWETQGWQTEASPQQALVEASARTFMARVYRWMFLGLALTGGIALYTATNEALLSFAMKNMVFLIVAELGAVLALSWLAPRISAVPAALLFLAYSALNGLTLSLIFLVYTQGSIAQTFFVASGMFAAMSVYGTVTKKDLTGWGSFLFMGLIGIVLAGVVNLFLKSDAMAFVVSCAGVVVFTGLTAYDTQKLRNMHASSGYSSAASLSISGALTLYLDFINLFLSLLRLMGRRR
jgi:FtsH-binding integral membrane protein